MTSVPPSQPKDPSMPTPKPRPKALESLCAGGHDVVRDSDAVWINDDTYLPAIYKCMVCGYAWENEDEAPTAPRPSKFHVQGS